MIVSGSHQITFTNEEWQSFRSLIHSIYSEQHHFEDSPDSVRHVVEFNIEDDERELVERLFIDLDE